MKKIAIEEHIPPEDKLESVEQRLKDMDEAGIDMQVLNYIFPFDPKASAADGLSQSQTVNNAIANLVNKYPARFAGLAAVALQDPAAAADELERAVIKLGLKGTILFPPIPGYVDNKQYWCIYERAAKLGVPVYLHPGPPHPDMIKPYQDYPLLTSATWGYAAEADLGAMRLIFSGVFDEYPDFKVILGHLGESIPYWLWRIDSHWRKVEAGMAKPDPSVARLKKKPSEYFRDNFYVTTSGMFWWPALQLVCTAVGADKTLFAVDYPQEDMMNAVSFINNIPLNDFDKAKICHLNAERLFKL